MKPNHTLKTKMILLVLLLVAQVLAAQDSLLYRGRKAVVKLIASDHKVAGYIEEAGDTALVMAIPIRGLMIDTASLLIIPVSRIHSIILYKKRDVGEGMGRGALFGITIGGLLGIATGSATDKSESSMDDSAPAVLGFLGVVGGAVTGLFVGGLAPGNTKETIPVNGSLEEYNRLRESMNLIAQPI